LALDLALFLPVQWGWMERPAGALAAVGLLGGLCAYGLALLVCLKIVEEYRDASWLRWAWLGLTANAAILLFRPLAQEMLAEALWPDFHASPWRLLLRHTVIVAGNLALGLSLLAMWWGYRRLRLGFHLRRRDFAAMAGLLILLAGLIGVRENLTEATSPFVVNRVLQLAGLALLFIIAVAGIMLQRIAEQMNGGRLAVALRWLTLYVLLRLGLVVLASSLRSAYPEALWASDVARFAWQSVAWVFTLTVVYQMQVTLTAAEELERVRQKRIVGKPALIS
ncbi:MAG: hypothetical protein ACREAB_19505, partial [Blastocatellia bacterium]